MPPRKIVWNEKAIQDVQELAEARDDKLAVLSCIESNVLAVATNPEITRLVPGPLRERIFRFQCMDGNTELTYLAVFVYTPNEGIALLRVERQQF